MCATDVFEQKHAHKGRLNNPSNSNSHEWAATYKDKDCGHCSDNAKRDHILIEEWESNHCCI